MDYTIFQIVILINDSLSINKKREIVKEIRHSIEKWTRKVNIKYEDSRPLAYKIDNYETAWFVAIQLRLKSIGANKRIRKIEEKLNTYEEIIEFKIVEKNKRIDIEQDDKENNVYIVYEFDYGDANEEIEPRVTHFGSYRTIDKARKCANELLQEGLELFYIDASLADEIEPFKKYNEIHLYKQKDKAEQNASVYYVKIEKLNLE